MWHISKCIAPTTEETWSYIDKLDLVGGKDTQQRITRTELTHLELGLLVPEQHAGSGHDVMHAGGGALVGVHLAHGALVHS